MASKRPNKDAWWAILLVGFLVRSLCHVFRLLFRLINLLFTPFR